MSEGFFSRAAGQKRRAWLDSQEAKVANALRYYLGPTGIDRRANALSQVAPLAMSGTDYMDAATASNALSSAVQNRQPWEAVAQAGTLAGAGAAMMVPGVSYRMAQGATDAGVGAAQAARRFAAGEAGAVGPRGIRAYHGSPHDFDRFDMSKIGTGEGAQAYGHGLYFAESEGVARAYRDALTGRGADWAPTGPQTFIRKADGANLDITQIPYGVVRAARDQRDVDYSSLLSRAEEELRRASSVRNEALRAPQLRQAQEAVDWLKSNRGVRFEANPEYGRMYEVNINARPEDFLDSDLALRSQPESVRRALEPIQEGFQSARINDFDRAELLRGDATGAQLYSAIAHTQPGAGSAFDRAAGATQTLREAGIPGIRYLDAGSRGAGDGSRNFVVFDENLIEIVRKYGIAGAASMLGVTAADVSQAMEQGRQPQGWQAAREKLRSLGMIE